MPQPPTSESPASPDATPEAAEPPSPSANPVDEPEPSPGQPSPGSPRVQSPGPLGIEVTFTRDTPDTDPPAEGWLDVQLGEALRLSGVTTGSLSVTLIDDATMIALHAEHCDDPTPTDVLTFDLADRDPPKPGDPVTHIDGDLVICRDEAQRQAADRGHDARTELLLYAVHGLMHLLGEDDLDASNYQRMHQREDCLLTQMGFGPVFHGQAAETATPEAGGAE